jgi:hypothetical protein
MPIQLKEETQVEATDWSDLCQKVEGRVAIVARDLVKDAIYPQILSEWGKSVKIVRNPPVPMFPDDGDKGIDEHWHVAVEIRGPKMSQVASIMVDILVDNEATNLVELISVGEVPIQAIAWANVYRRDEMNYRYKFALPSETNGGKYEVLDSYLLDGDQEIDPETELLYLADDADVSGAEGHTESGPLVP